MRIYRIRKVYNYMSEQTYWKLEKKSWLYGWLEELRWLNDENGENKALENKKTLEAKANTVVLWG